VIDAFTDPLKDVPVWRAVTVWEEYERDVDAYPLERTDQEPFRKWCHHREAARAAAKDAGDDNKMARMFAAPFLGLARQVIATYDPDAWGEPFTTHPGAAYAERVWHRNMMGRSLTDPQRELVAVLEAKIKAGTWKPWPESFFTYSENPTHAPWGIV